MLPQQPRLQNFWIYTIAIVALMCALQYIGQACLTKPLAKHLTTLGYLVLLYVVIASFVWNNDPEWRAKKNEPTTHRVTKNVVDSLLLVIILSVLYCKFVR